MASPLSWFRRNQKGMLVVFGVLLMASFGLGSVMYSLTPRGVGNASQETPVVEWRGGTFTNGDISNMRYRHFRTMNFLQQLQQSMLEQRGRFYQPRARMLTPMYDGVSPDQMDRQVMQRVLALQEAKEIGIQVSNEAVMSYLRNLADDQNLSQRDMDGFCTDFFNNSVDFIEIREQLKNELAIEQVNLMMESGIPFSPSLTEAWQDFLKMETRTECEIMAFPVEDYIAKVTESPSNSELRTLYEAGKYEYPDVAGERPGFKRPRKLSITMLTADYGEFLERAKLAITPEEIQAEYDRLVAINDPLVTEIVPQDNNQDNLDGDDPPPTLDDMLIPESESGEAPTPAPGDETAPSAPDDPNDGGSSDEPPTDDDDGREPTQSSQYPASPGIPARLVSSPIPKSGTAFEQDETGTPARETESGSGTGQPSDNSEMAADPQTENQTNDPNSATAQPDELSVPVQPPVEPAMDQQDSPPGLDLESPIQMRTRPLDEFVSDGIRTRLAGKPAMDAMTQAITDATADIGDYGVDFEMWHQTKDLPVDEREPEPDPIDAAAVAAKYRLKYQHADLCSQLEFEDTEMGKTMVSVEVPSVFGVQKRDIQISNLLFDQFYRLETWRPENYEEYFRPNLHVVFVEEKKNPEIPEFTEARDDVEQFWKRERALELATAAAAEVAEQLNASGQSLTERNPGQAKNTGDFTWHTQTSLFPVLPGNIRPGEEFMKTAFSTEPGQAGIATDALRENVFVIQPIRRDPRTREELEALFFESLSANQGVGAGLSQLYQNQLREMYRDWFEKLDDEYDVKWLAN